MIHIFGDNNFFEQFVETPNIVTLIVTLIGTFLGFLFALFSDRIISIFNRKTEEREEYQLKLELIEYLKFIIDRLIDYIPEQTIIIKNLSEEIKKAPTEFFKVEMRGSFELIRMHRADNKSIRESYLFFFKDSKEVYKDYHYLFTCSDYVFGEVKTFEERMEVVHNDMRINVTEIKSKTVELYYLIFSRLRKLEKEYKKSLFVKKSKELEFLEGIEKLPKSEDAVTNEYMREKFIKPVLFFYSQFNDEILFNSKVLHLTREIELLFLRIKRNNRSFAKDILDFEERIEPSLLWFKSESEKISQVLNKG